MLMLISPPGYGKTTLMEYVAHRLGPDLHEDQRPGAGPRGAFARSGAGARCHLAAGARETQPRAGDGQQRDAVCRRHPAHPSRIPAEVHLAVRRHPAHRGRLAWPHPHLRPARQEVLRGDGRQPVHRVRRGLQDPGHAGQPRRHLQPRRRARWHGRRVPAQLRRELPHLQPGAGAAGHPRPRRPVQAGRQGAAAASSPPTASATPTAAPRSTRSSRPRWSG